MRLSDIKEGDVVVVVRNVGAFSTYERYDFAKVLSVGLKKIKTNKGDFSASNGNEWGGTPYHCDRIETDVTIEEARRLNDEAQTEQKRIKLANELREFRWRDLNLETLEKVKQLTTAH